MKKIFSILAMFLFILISCESQKAKTIEAETTDTQTSNEGALLLREVKDFVEKYLAENELGTKEVAVEDLYPYPKGKTMPLLYSLPDDNIYIYGINGEKFGQDFMLLKVEDNYQIIEQHFYSPRAITLRLSYRDFNGDGINELAVIYYLGGGTGVSHYALEMFSINDAPETSEGIFCVFKSAYMDDVEISEFISSKIVKTECNVKDGRYIVDTFINDIAYSIDITGLIEDNEDERLTFIGFDLFSVVSIDIAEYTDYRIVGEIPLGIGFEERAMAEYTSEYIAVHAEILWDGENFSFGDIWVTQ